MLTLEENVLNFKALQFSSALNLLPLEIDMTTGTVQKQSSKLRVFLWRILFCSSILYLLYLLGRLFQMTILEPEKYFRWDHFILHFAAAFGFAGFYYTGFWLFGENLEEYVIINNELFKGRENPVQKMMDQELKGTKNFGKKGVNGAKSAARPKTTTALVSIPAQEEEEKESSRKILKESGPKVRPLLTWPPKYSLDELLAKMFPVVLVPTWFFGLSFFAIDPTRPQLLYSSLPPEYQNISSFLGLLAVEAFFVMLVFAYANSSIVGQLLFFSKCQAEFKRLNLQLRNLEEKFQERLFKNRDIRREIWILRQISKEMRELVLFIELFNRSFPFCIFAFKLVCLAVSVLFYFFTIRHFQSFPFFAVFTGYIAVAITLIYGILYQKAFSIPQKTEQLKNEFLSTVHKSTNLSFNSAPTLNLNPTLLKGFRAEMTREIGGIRDVGVKVGSFHTLERESTPSFVDFVMRSVVNLLVTFKQ